MQILQDVKDTIRGFFYDLKAEIIVSANHCPACATEFTESANFCSNCGEPKPVIPRDISLYALLKEYVADLAKFNTKFITTWLWLLFRPGLLSKAHFLGIKNRVLSAYTILISVIAFYHFTNSTTIFYTSVEEMAQGYQHEGFNFSNVLKFDIRQKIIERSKEINKERSNFETKLEKYADLNSNLYLLVFWPVWGIVIALVMYKGGYHLGWHFIFAANMLSTFLVWRTIIYYVSFDLLGLDSLSNISSLYVNLAFMLYTIYSCAIAFQISISYAFVKGLMISLSFFGLIIMYRQAWTLISFYSIT